MTARAPWTLTVLAAAALATSAALALDGAGPLGADGAAIAHGQLWRLLTGPLVHATWTHLLWDATILLVLGLVYERRFGHSWPLLLFAGLVIPTAATLATPGIDVYFGISGVNYTIMAAAVLLECRERPLVGIAGGALLALKLWRCASGRSAVGPALPPGVHEAPVAHLVAAGCGTLIGWCRSWSAAHRSSTPAPPACSPNAAPAPPPWRRPAR